MISFAASAFAEVFSLALYYPFDLIKTRMQTAPKYEYTNVFDAVLKLYREEASGSNIFRRVLSRFYNFYRGVGLYGGTYITYIALEFSLFESFLQVMEMRGSHKHGEIIGNSNHYNQ